MEPQNASISRSKKRPLCQQYRSLAYTAQEMTFWLLLIRSTLSKPMLTGATSKSNRMIVVKSLVYWSTVSARLWCVNASTEVLLKRQTTLTFNLRSLLYCNIDWLRFVCFKINTSRRLTANRWYICVFCNPIITLESSKSTCVCKCFLELNVFKDIPLLVFDLSDLLIYIHKHLT